MKWYTLGSMFSRDGRYEMDVERRIAAGNRTSAQLRVWPYTMRFWCIDTVIRQRNGYYRRKMNGVEMRSLRGICGVSLANQIHNKEIHRMAGSSEDVTVRMKKNLFSLLFGYVERMAKKIYDGKVSSKKGRGDLS